MERSGFVDLLDSKNVSSRRFGTSATNFRGRMPNGDPTKAPEPSGPGGKGPKRENEQKTYVLKLLIFMVLSYAIFIYPIHRLKYKMEVRQKLFFLRAKMCCDVFNFFHIV